MSIETLGQYLKQEREFRKVSREDLSKQTKISLRVLTALEEDRYQELPQGTFVRGFLKVYARHIGLNEAEILKRYETLIEKGTVVMAEDDFARFAIKRPRSKWFGVVLFLAFLLLIAVYFTAR